MSDFPCTQCGLCCRSVGLALKYRDFYEEPGIRAALEAFPYAVDENGVCEKLVDNKCSVYENRPYICNIDAVAELRGVSKDEWYRLSAKACNFMIRQAGLDESYLITDYDSE